MMLRVQDAGTHRTAQSRVLVLDAVLTQQAGVVPLPAGSCSTLDAYSAVLTSPSIGWKSVYSRLQTEGMVSFVTHVTHQHFSVLSWILACLADFALRALPTCPPQRGHGHVQAHPMVMLTTTGAEQLVQ